MSEQASAGFYNSRRLRVEPEHLQLYAIQPKFIGQLMECKVRLSGVPVDAEYVRSYHDPNTDTFYLLYRHPSFEEAIEGIMMIPHPLTVTDYHEAP